MAYEKGKFSFSIGGVKYSDIIGSSDTNSGKIFIRVAGTAQMVRQWIKQKYPKIPSKNYYWVNSRSFANGNAIDVYLNYPNNEIWENLRVELRRKFEYGSYHYGSQQESKDIVSKTDEGKSIDYGTKYLTVNSEPPYGTSAPSVDWSILTSLASASTIASVKPQNNAVSDVLKDCAGWVISKRISPTGQILYEAKIKPDTPVNKEQWQEIKNEIYTQTGFKWGKFSSFEKWGVIASEAAVVDILCNILDKYYPTQSQAPQVQQSQEEPLFHPGDRFQSRALSYFYEIISINGEDVEYARHDIDDGTIKNRSRTIKYINKQIQSGEWVKYAPQPQNEGINESYKDLPENPKLEFCAINKAEGSYPDDLFPIRFQSFTALTKFIADNIGELPKEGEGYDKYYISWKWKFKDKEQSERWDVSENEANPDKYPNLWAYQRMSYLCFGAWIGEFSDMLYEELDSSNADAIGKDGWELNSVQFMALLGQIINNYDEGIFKYHTFKERFDRFAEVYPKLFKLFSDVDEPKNNKENIQKAINGLKLLADKGNEKAAKAIKGLQYLLNK